MPASTSTPIQTGRQTTAVLIVRDLCATVALCYLITLALLRLIAAHLDFYASPAFAACGAGGGAEYRAYQRALEGISHVDVLKVTTACSVVAFVALELCVLLARRAGVPCRTRDVDLERGGSDALQPVSAYPPEKQCVIQLSPSSI